MGLNTSADQCTLGPLGLERNTGVQNHTAPRTFPAQLWQFDLLLLILTILKIPLGDFLFPPSDSTNIPLGAYFSC